MATEVKFWQPGTFFQPQDIVQENRTPAIAVQQPDNADFELGDQDWTKDAEFAINNAGQAFDGTFRAVYNSSASAEILGFLADGASKRAYRTVAPGSSVPYAENAVAAKYMAASGTVFIALDENAAFTSPDGITWTPRTPSWSSVELDLVEFDPLTQLFFAFEALSDQYHTSPDGIAWTARTFPINDNNTLAATHRRTMATNGLLTVVLSSATADIYTTTDGISWTARTEPPAFLAPATNLVYAAALGKFYMVDSFKVLYFSSNGINWTTHSTSQITALLSGQGVISLAWSESDGVLAALVNGGIAQGATTTKVVTSSDGGTFWNFRNSFEGNWIRYSNALNNFISTESSATRGRLNRSGNGTSWSQTEYDTGIVVTVAYPSADLCPALGTFNAINDARPQVQVGQELKAECQVLSSASGSGQIGIAWYDSGLSLIRIDRGSPRSGSVSNFRRARVTATAPALATNASVVISGSGGSEVLFDAVSWDYFFQPFKTGLLYKAVQNKAGFSGSNEPSFDPIIGNTTPDNEVIWETIEANCIIWEAIAILKSGPTEPTFPTEIGASVVDNTILWIAQSQRVLDTNCPNTPEVAIAASKIFAGDDDIVPFSATINPLDWTTPEDAGYIPFGLNTYGSDPVSALGIYRSNLVIFNAKAFQMWQVDEDPNNFAILDAVPVGCRFPRSLSPVSNDLVFLTDEGIRNIGIAGASTNLQAGFFGKQIDPLVLEAIKGGEVPDALFFPGAGQYWLFFGEEAFVLTMNGGKADMSWSRYTFPSAVDDWALQDGKLFLRSGEKVWQVDNDTLFDDAGVGGTNVEFIGEVTWPYLDFGALGVTKQLIGFDVVANGKYTVSVGYDQKRTNLATPPYAIDGDTLPGDIIPLPIAAPSMQLRLVFEGNAIVGGGDSDFDNVVLLLPFDGSDGATATVDESNSAHIMTFNSDAEISTVQSQFGGSSLAVNNTFQPDIIDDVISTPIDSDFDFGTQDWTIEYWIYSALTNFADTVIAIGTSAGGDQMIALGQSPGFIDFLWTDDAVEFIEVCFVVPAWVANTWHHVAVERQGGNLRAFYDGTESTTGAVTVAGTGTFRTPTGFVVIGGEDSPTAPGREWQGFIDDLRITKGTARYSGNFTPTVNPFGAAVPWEWSAATLYLQDFRRSS